LVLAALIVSGVHGLKSEDHFAGGASAVVDEVEAWFHEELVPYHDLQLGNDDDGGAGVPDDGLLDARRDRVLSFLGGDAEGGAKLPIRRTCKDLELPYWADRSWVGGLSDSPSS
jgi:hypothetical protein